MPKNLTINQCDSNKTSDFVFKIPEPSDPEGAVVKTIVKIASAYVYYDKNTHSIKQI